MLRLEMEGISRPIRRSRSALSCIMSVLSAVQAALDQLLFFA